MTEMTKQEQQVWDRVARNAFLNGAVELLQGPASYEPSGNFGAIKSPWWAMSIEIHTVTVWNMLTGARVTWDRHTSQIGSALFSAFLEKTAHEVQ